MLSHEALSGASKHPGVAGLEQLVDGIGREAAADHRVVDALAGGGRDHAGRVAGEHHVAAVVPARQRLHRQRRALAAQRTRVLQADLRTQLAGGGAQREALVGAACADAQRLAVREHPAVEVGRELALVPDVAPAGVVAGGPLLGHRYDLVVGEDELATFRAGHGLAGDRRVGAVGADDRAGAHARGRPLAESDTFAQPVVDDGGAVGVALDPLEHAGAAHRARFRCAFAQELVEAIPVDHADVAALDRDIHVLAGRRHHARAVGARDDLFVRDRVVLDQTRRHGAAAGLDAPGAV